MGLPAEGAAYTYPQDMFLQGSDLTPIEENIGSVVAAFTTWQPKKKGKVSIAQAMITVEGKDYEEAISNMNNLFLRNTWSDGLPILPPTKERVKWLLTGTDLSPDTLVGGGRILPKGGIATVEMLAVNLAMTGGRPEYMPVLIAAVEGFTGPSTNHQAWTSTTGSTTPLVIVNGPVAGQIRLNRGYGLLGPTSEYPAGGIIGRAIRLILLNLGGAIPGKGTMSLYGGPNRYTNYVFAEDEEGLPDDWLPLNTEYGFAKGSNTLTTDVIGLSAELFEGAAVTEEETLGNLKSWANFIGGAGSGYSEGIPGYILIGRSAAQGLSKLGWTKDKVKQFIWENAKVQEPISQDARNVLLRHHPENKNLKWPAPIAKKPENIKIVVCGGAQSGHSYWIRVINFRSKPGEVEIKLPANWEQLLKQAEEDLGPMPG